MLASLDILAFEDVSERRTDDEHRDLRAGRVREGPQGDHRRDPGPAGDRRPRAPAGARAGARQELARASALHLRPEQGFRVHLLHEEPDHGLAVLGRGRRLPGRGAPHNHGTWAVVAGRGRYRADIFWQPAQRTAPGLVTRRSGPRRRADVRSRDDRRPSCPIPSTAWSTRADRVDGVAPCLWQTSRNAHGAVAVRSEEAAPKRSSLKQESAPSWRRRPGVPGRSQDSSCDFPRPAPLSVWHIDGRERQAASMKDGSRHDQDAVSVHERRRPAARHGPARRVVAGSGQRRGGVEHHRAQRPASRADRTPSC